MDSVHSQKGVALSPIEIIAAIMLITVLSVSTGKHSHAETDTEVWYCFVCAGMKSNTEVNEELDHE